VRGNCDLGPLKYQVVLYFFRNIHFSTALLLVLYVFGLHFTALAGWFPVVRDTADAGLLYMDIFGSAAANSFTSSLLAVLLVTVQTIMINSIADQFRLMEPRSWLPGAAFALITALLPSFLYISATLVASFFVVWSLRFLFYSYKSSKSPLYVFDIALCIGGGSLFYPRAMLIIPALFIAVGIMRSWGAREYLVFLTGLILPLLLGWTWYFWYDRGGEFFQRHVSDVFNWPQMVTGLDISGEWPGLTVIALLFLFFVFNIFSYMRGKSILVQKSVTVMFWLLVFGGLHIFFCTDWQWNRFLLVSAPAGLLLAYSYEDMKPLYAEILHLIILTAVFGLQFMQISVS
jgi:hypothetical protein